MYLFIIHSKDSSGSWVREEYIQSTSFDEAFAWMMFVYDSLGSGFLEDR